MLIKSKNPKYQAAPIVKHFKSAPSTKKITSGHSKALPVHNIDLTQPGRLRVGHLLTLYSVSHSGLYAHLGTKYPAPDGRDGGRPYWKTNTVLKSLEGA